MDSALQESKGERGITLVIREIDSEQEEKEAGKGERGKQERGRGGGG